MKKKRKRHAPEQIVKKLRDADVMLNTGKSLEEVLKVLEVSEATLARWRSQYGGMKSEEAKRLKELEGENARLKRLLAEAELDKAMLKERSGETTEPDPERGRRYNVCGASSRYLSVGHVAELDFTATVFVTSDGQSVIPSRFASDCMNWLGSAPASVTGR
jgi:transposase-like protein